MTRMVTIQKSQLFPCEHFQQQAKINPQIEDWAYEAQNRLANELEQLTMLNNVDLTLQAANCPQEIKDELGQHWIDTHSEYTA